MKVNDIQVRTLELMEIDEGGEIGRLDPITVQLRNYRPGAGSITITCFGQSWSAAWGAMSGQTVEHFFCTSGPDYLISNLAGGLYHERNEENPDWWPIYFEEIINTRINRRWQLTAERAREIWDQLVRDRELGLPLDPEHQVDDRDLLDEIRGEPWYECIPTESNPDYEYLERIIRAVQKGLQSV